jgi:hypothetical protein
MIVKKKQSIRYRVTAPGIHGIEGKTFIGPMDHPKRDGMIITQSECTDRQWDVLNKRNMITPIENKPAVVPDRSEKMVDEAVPEQAIDEQTEVVEDDIADEPVEEPMKKRRWGRKRN